MGPPRNNRQQPRNLKKGAAAAPDSSSSAPSSASSILAGALCLFFSALIRYLDVATFRCAINLFRRSEWMHVRLCYRKSKFRVQFWIFLPGERMQRKDLWRVQHLMIRGGRKFLLRRTSALFPNSTINQRVEERLWEPQHNLS